MKHHYKIDVFVDYICQNSTSYNQHLFRKVLRLHKFQLVNPLHTIDLCSCLFFHIQFQANLLFYQYKHYGTEYSSLILVRHKRLNRRNRQTLWGECTEANPKTCC